MSSFNVILVVWCLIGLGSGQGDLISSTQELHRVFRLEQDLVKTLRGQKENLENTLKEIKSYTAQVQDMYERENCWPHESCPPQQFVDRILGNPIYNFQVLKRLLVYFKHVEAELKSMDMKKTLGELRKARNRHGGMPTEVDLQGAAKALNRLQEVYRLNTTDFAKGQIMGLQTAAELTVKDTYFLGRSAFKTDNHAVALRWLEEAALQVAAESDGGDNSTVVLGGINEKQIEQMKRQVLRKLPLGFKEMMDEEDEIENERKYRLGNIPPKTHDHKKFQNEDDKINYFALCQGKYLLPEKERANHMCYYTHLDDYYFYIGPIKMEVLHRSPHLVQLYHDVIWPSEIQALIDTANPRMAKASVGHDRTLTELRVSRSAWLEDGASVVDRVSQRLNWITGLQTSQKLDRFNEGKLEEYEKLQIANYGIGGHYGAHQDPMYVYKEPDYMAKLGEGTTYITGDRMSTLMMYLSDVTLGGLTVFPRLGVAVKPVKGAAVFWNNIKRSGRQDMAMLHGGCPVLLGSKWVANKWIREAANIFHRPCINGVEW